MITLCKTNLLSAFSLALDLAENKTMGHAKRTAYLALTLARKMDMDEKELDNVYAAAFLHDIGVTNAKRDYHKEEDLLKAHPRLGAEMVKNLPFGAEVIEYVRLHHINWDGSNAYHLEENQPDEIPLGAQIVYLADQVDLRFDKNQCPYLQRNTLLGWLKEKSGQLFRPDMVEAFLELANNEKFWLDYNFYNIEEILKDIQPKISTEINLSQLESIAETFARVIDNKSKFTSKHSRGLSELIQLTAKCCRFGEEEILQAKIAGLLHDLGKLSVPNEILDKPGRLNAQEFCIVKGHTYYTKMILGMVNGFEEIKEWAGNHHETIDGFGYPEGIKGEKLSIVERLMAVCDVYQALIEDRPYRPGMAETQAFGIISQMVNDNKLCPEGFDILKKAVS